MWKLVFNKNIDKVITYNAKKNYIRKCKREE